MPVEVSDKKAIAVNDNLIFEVSLDLVCHFKIANREPLVETTESLQWVGVFAISCEPYSVSDLVLSALLVDSQKGNLSNNFIFVENNIIGAILAGLKEMEDVHHEVIVWC